MPKASTAMAKPSGGYSIHSVEKALDLLEAICDQGGEARITELSQCLGMNKTNVFRLLATFERRGLVERGEDSVKYRLGMSAYEMGRKLLSHMDVLRKARPAMERLARQTGEAVYVMAPRQNEVLMLDMIDSPHQVKVVSLTCRSLPLSADLGQIFVAFGPTGARERRVYEDSEGRGGDQTERLATIRHLGYTVDRKSFGDGVTSLGVPLFNHKGQSTAALAVIGPSFRMTEQRIERELLPVLLEAGFAVSTSLGFFRDYAVSKAV